MKPSTAKNLIEKPNITIWTIYFSPKDFPGEWIARLFELDQPTKSILRASGLDELRWSIQNDSDYERVVIPRSENDQPSVIESWI
jgi:hypothetical protein